MHLFSHMDLPSTGNDRFPTLRPVIGTPTGGGASPYRSIGTLRSDNGDVHENVAEK